jgi:hypothetical protein
MAFLGQTFNQNDMPESGGFEPVPAGWYQCAIERAELKDTKSGGQMISVMYKILGPSHEGRTFFGNINIKNANPQAEEIGRQELGSIMRAANLPELTDTDQLMGVNLDVKTKIEKSEQYGDKNAPAGFRPFNNGSGSVPGGQSSAPAQSAQPRSAPAEDPAAGTAPPWAQ